MQFHALELPGAFVIDLEPVLDERGFFARAWDEREFAAHGLETRLVQCSLSYNRQAGTLRGIHLQLPPFAEVKLVRCVRGALYDVVLDLRSDSPAFGRWTAVTLSAENRRAVYVPRGCAHGFQTLADDTEVYYQISELYAPEHARGVRWNDPRFGVEWPRPVSVISLKDAGYPDFAPDEFAALAGLTEPADGQRPEAARISA
jgi:dTDP-4-dehydrorhamnose 3,5-epimerase